MNTLATAGWVQVVGALAVELVEGLLHKARHQASAIATQEAGEVLARSLMRVPASIRQHSGKQIAEGLVDGLAHVARLDAATAADLLEVVGVELLKLTLREVSDLAAETVKVSRL